MRVPTPAAMAGLLRARLEAGGSSERVLTLNELLDEVLPYAVARTALHLAGKAEYDLSILGFLASREHAQVDPAVLDAVTKELDSGEPELAFAEELGDCLLRLRAGAPARKRRRGPFELVEPEVPAPAGRAEPSSEAAEPASADGEPAGSGGSGEAAESPTAAEAPESAAVGVEPRPEEAAVEPAGSAPAVEEPPAAASEGGASFAAPGEGAGPETGRLCGACGEELPPRPGIRFCPRCGAGQRPSRCLDCGERIDAAWHFCVRCGRELGGS